MIVHLSIANTGEVKKHSGHRTNTSSARPDLHKFRTKYETQNRKHGAGRAYSLFSTHFRLNLNNRSDIVSVSSRSRRICECLQQLCVCVSRLVPMVCIWCTRSLGRLNFLELLLRHNALVGGHPGPRKKADENSSTR